jgi:hypothetical protein
MKSTAFLIQEHKVILRALDVLDAMSASIEETETCELADIDKILDFLRWLPTRIIRQKKKRLDRLFFRLRLHRCIAIQQVGSE